METRKIFNKREKKGFIGPLGDDIPSIFPIVLGVVIFLGTILYINNAVATRNADFNLRRTALSLGYIATQKGTYTPEEFGSLCNSSLIPFANQQNAKFAVVMKRHCNKINFNSNPYFSGYDQTNYAVGVCTNAVDQKIDKINWALLDQQNSIADAKQFGPNNTIMLNYPIAVPCPETTNITLGLGLMNVIVWPKNK